MKQHIFFTLDPENEIELTGLLENLRRIPVIYPSWEPIVVVPEGADTLKLGLITGLGASIELEQTSQLFVHRSVMSLLHAISRRGGNFRFLIRSPFCRIGRREAAAVDAWVKSSVQTHVIRDHATEHDTRIVPHLWGSFQARVQQLGKKVTLWFDDLYKGRSRDMIDLTKVESRMLGDVVWPRLVNWGILRHDPFPRTFDHPGVPWPAYEPDDQEACGIVYIDDPEKGTNATEERNLEENPADKHPGNDPRGETQGCCGSCGI
jgi:hypothetical protein